jgi:magnesium chelatase subunit D
MTDGDHAAPPTGIEPGISPERTPGPRHGYHHPRANRVSSKRIDWFRTLVAAENLEAGRLRVLRSKPAPQNHLTFNCILLDTSASTLSRKALAQAKGLVLGIAETAYLAREHLAILSFGNQRVDWIMRPRRAPKDCSPCLAQIQGGGGTPLRRALQAAQHMLARLQRRHPQLRCRTFLLTDGRSRDPVSDIAWASPLWVIDTERSQVRLNRCKQLALQLHARYLALDATVPTG